MGTSHPKAHKARQETPEANELSRVRGGDKNHARVALQPTKIRQSSNSFPDALYRWLQELTKTSSRHPTKSKLAYLRTENYLRTEKKNL